MPHASTLPRAEVDLYAPLEKDVIVQVRLGKMKTMPGLDIESGIDKSICNGPVWVTKTGLKGDEHDLTFHGGVDKAVHGYCSSHYQSWKSEFPSAAARFVSGGFGENLVTVHMNERNVCIGDIFAVGSGDDPLLLQVSLPRQPCFKLNHRFQLKNFAPNTWRLSRTGWYYRVLREGPVQAGDEIRLRKRRYPEWTIERLQEYLHRQTDDEEMNRKLATIEDMGEESRGNFQRRVDRATAKAEKRKGERWQKYRLVEKTKQTPRVTSFVFEPATLDVEIPEGRLHGAHVKLRLPNGLVRTYSIVSGVPSRFELGVALDEGSRGGSKYLHDEMLVDDIIQVGAFTDDIKKNAMASNHVFVVGGIGITAFLAMAKYMLAINFNFKIHYAIRNQEEVPFRNTLEEFGQRVIFYDKSKGERLSIDHIIDNLPWNSQLYFCGPTRLMDEAALKVKAAGIPEGEVHFEAFSADIGGDPFEAVVASTGDTLKVGEDETLLEVLKRNFDDIPSSCEVGNCGTCKITVKYGKVEHRGTALTSVEKESSMLSCVSRGIGKIEIDF